MKKQLLLLILILTSLFMTSSSYAYTLVGAASCGELLTLEDKGNLISKHSTPLWIKGYITGRNYELDRTMKNPPDSDSLYYALIKFCRDNPLKDIDDAAISIYSKIN